LERDTPITFARSRLHRSAFFGLAILPAHSYGRLGGSPFSAILLLCHAFLTKNQPLSAGRRSPPLVLIFTFECKEIPWQLVSRDTVFRRNRMRTELFRRFSIPSSRKVSPPPFSRQSGSTIVSFLPCFFVYRAICFFLALYRI